MNLHLEGKRNTAGKIIKSRGTHESHSNRRGRSSESSGDPTSRADMRIESRAGRPPTRLLKLKECSTVTRRSINDLNKEKQATVCLKINSTAVSACRPLETVSVVGDKS
jgi:hypothetical protein